MTTQIINNFNSLNSEDLSIVKVGHVSWLGSWDSWICRTSDCLTGTSVGTVAFPSWDCFRWSIMGHG